MAVGCELAFAFLPAALPSEDLSAFGFLPDIRSAARLAAPLTVGVVAAAAAFGEDCLTDALAMRTTAGDEYKAAIWSTCC
jgi:hypothetical protein